MTRLQQYAQTEKVLKVVRSVLEKRLTQPKFVRAEFSTRYENHSGEPALYVYVEMPREQDIPSVAAQNELTVELLVALEKLGDERFPYVSFGPREGDDEQETVYEPED